MMPDNRDALATPKMMADKLRPLVLEEGEHSIHLKKGTATTILLHLDRLARLDERWACGTRWGDTNEADEAFRKELRGVLADCSEFLAYIDGILADRCEAMLSQIVADQSERDELARGE